MIRKCTDEDISDEELEKVINPFYDNYHEYIITYVKVEVIKLLRMKYSSEIISENPLDFKKIEY